MRRAANHRLSWRIGAVSIGTMALGAVGTGTGAAATGCGDCPTTDARCVVSGAVKVQADDLPVGKLGDAADDLVSGAQKLITGKDCGTDPVDVGDSPSADPGRVPRPGERHSSEPRERAHARQSIPEPLRGDAADLPAIPSPRGTHFSIPRPVRSDVRLPTVATPPRVTTVANAEETGPDGTSWLIALAAASAGMVGGANLALLAMRRRTSGTT